MPQPDYIPGDDAGFHDWVDNFNAKLTAAPTTVGLVAGDATALDALFDIWLAAYNLTLDPDTRTSVTIAAKDTARFNLEALARLDAIQIQAFPGTTDEERVDFGLTVPTGFAAPVAAPATRPLVQVLTNASNQHTIKLRDELEPTSQAKPDGVTSAEIWVKIGGDPPTSIASCSFRGDYTRNPHTVEFAGGETGLPAYYIARWKTARGLVGPESPVVLATIAA